MRINRRMVDWIGLGAVVAAVLACTLLAVNVARGQRQRLQTRKALADRGMEECNRAQTVLARLRAALTAAQEDFRELDEKVPQSGRIGAFLASIDGLMQQKRVVLVDIQPQPSIVDEFYTRTPVRMSCSGAFADIHALLYELETMPRFVRMESVVIARSPVSDQCNMQLDICLFER